MNFKFVLDVVYEACKRLGVKPAEALVIGDSRFDEGAAQAAGAEFVWFRSFAELRLTEVQEKERRGQEERGR